MVSNVVSDVSESIDGQSVGNSEIIMLKACARVSVILAESNIAAGLKPRYVMACYTAVRRSLSR